MTCTISRSLTISFKSLKKTALLALPACLLLSGNVYSATLFFDDFNGSVLYETELTTTTVSKAAPHSALADQVCQ